MIARLAWADSRALARSAALAWAAAESLSIWRRIRPHRSACQESDGPMVNWLRLPLPELTTPPCVLRPLPLPLPLCVKPALPETVG